MREELLRGQRSGDWVGSSLQKKAPSSLTRSGSSQRKPKLRCYMFCRNGNLSAWAAISLSERTRGSSPPPIATWRLPSLRARFGAICFTASMFFRLRFLLCGKEKKTFLCWSSTSSTVSQERQERASGG